MPILPNAVESSGFTLFMDIRAGFIYTVEVYNLLPGTQMVMPVRRIRKDYLWMGGHGRAGRAGPPHPQTLEEESYLCF